MVLSPHPLLSNHFVANLGNRGMAWPYLGEPFHSAVAIRPANVSQEYLGYQRLIMRCHWKIEKSNIIQVRETITLRDVLLCVKVQVRI